MNSDHQMLLQLLGRIDQLEQLIKVQSSSGNRDISEYMRGLTNGLILAQATMTDTVPIFYEEEIKEEKYSYGNLGDTEQTYG